MNIYFRELRANLKSFLIWSVIVLLFVVVGFSKFSAYEGNPELLAILDAMPQAMIEAFSFNAFNLTTITGFYGVMLSYFGLILSIAAAMWGTDIITKEERDRTVEFALTLPVSRPRLITGKIAAAFTYCIGLLLVTWGSIYVGAMSYETSSEFFDFVWISMIALLLLQTIFLATGILIGCAMQHYKRAGSLAVSLILGTYFISVISGLNQSLDFLKYFTPFKYFSPAMLLHEARFESVYLWLSLGIIVVSLAGAYLSYGRRDLYI